MPRAAAHPSLALNTRSAAPSIPVNKSPVAESSEPKDGDLVERAQQGDMIAYETLVLRYRGKVFALAYSVVGNPEDANDIAQETFVRAWRALGRFRGQSSFYTWLYRITMNLGIDLKQKHTRHPSVELDEKIGLDDKQDVDFLGGKSDRPSAGIERSELQVAVRAAIEKLSPEHRTVIWLKEFDDLSYKDIAKTVGCSIGTVMSRLFYARKHLAKLLEDSEIR